MSTTEVSPAVLPVGINRRDVAMLGAVREARRAIDIFYDERLRNFPDGFFDAIAALFVLLGDQHQAWARPRWALLDAVEKFARVMDRHVHSSAGWPGLAGSIDGALLDHFARVANEVELLVDKGEPNPQPSSVRLESFEQLKRDGVRWRQICRIYGWLDGFGEPDKEKYDAAEAGTLKPPTHRENPPAWRGPSIRPSPGMLTVVADWFVNDLKLDGGKIDRLIDQYASIEETAAA